MTPEALEAFVRDGFLRLEGAFDPADAALARSELSRDLGCDPEDPASWNEPVVRLGVYASAPFARIAAAPALRAACDALVGADRWLPLGGLGTWPVRFPCATPPPDAGWHVDMSFGCEAPDFLDWRINVRSRGRALLLLFLASDVGPDDAPTRIRVGSHRPLARLLAPAGEAGLSLRELVAADVARTSDLPEALAAGPAGTAYLCHPFLVHSAQAHRGRTPRFMAQPPLLPRGELALDGPSPVERAIREAIQR